MALANTEHCTEIRPSFICVSICYTIWITINVESYHYSARELSGTYEHYWIFNGISYSHIISTNNKHLFTKVLATEDKQIYLCQLGQKETTENISVHVY